MDLSLGLCGDGFTGGNVYQNSSNCVSPPPTPVQYVNFISCGSSILRSHLRQPICGCPTWTGGHMDRVPPASARRACLNRSAFPVPVSEGSLRHTGRSRTPSHAPVELGGRASCWPGPSPVHGGAAGAVLPAVPTAKSPTKITRV